MTTDTMTANKHWYVVQVLSSHEDKVRRQILEARNQTPGMIEFVEEVLVPTEKVSEVKAGQQKISQKRIWPGYILVKMQMTDDSWHFVKGVSGVIDFVGGSKPSPLSDEEVSQVLTELEEKKEVSHKHQFNVGDKVKITDGVFVNFLGTILEVYHDKGKLSVMVSIFGRETRVDDLEFWQIEEITDES